MEHAEDLAARNGTAELWVQHSDRLARGDGKRARHTVEIALWALKHDVRVRTMQDPETFRDLLYAVVTGQRNNEDSRRRSFATQAGVKRAAARGEYIGHLPDGYVLDVRLDEQGRIRKQMKLDPERRRLFELIFRRALRGRSARQIAVSVDRAGWLAKPRPLRRRQMLPRAFDASRVYAILVNPRYAGLSVRSGEVMARDCWPAYITERQHEKIRLHAESRRALYRQSRGETFLLKGVLRCGVCGMRMGGWTGSPRPDRNSRRRYYCQSHTKMTVRGKCPGRTIDAHMAESLVVACLPVLLGASPSDDDRFGSPSEPDRESALVRLRRAVLSEDEQAIDAAIESMALERQPRAVLIADYAGSERRARESEDTERLQEWIKQEDQARTDNTREQSVALNQMLRNWFAEITMIVEANVIRIAATRRYGASPSSKPAEVVIDRASWTRNTRGARRQTVSQVDWDEAEILGAMQRWSDVHDRAPLPPDWLRGGTHHPVTPTVVRRLGKWQRALGLAGLEPSDEVDERPRWSDEKMAAAFRNWYALHGRVPQAIDWERSTPEHPTEGTVCARHGRFESGVLAAGLVPEPVPLGRKPRLSREKIAELLRVWTQAHGRVPVSSDWDFASDENPSNSAVRKYFKGGWRKALEFAGLAG